MVTCEANTEGTEIFAKRFEALTGNAPFPWQECLFLWFLSNKILPTDVSLPTGTGKTSIMAVWLLALAAKSSTDSRQISIPRRLIWVVNRRVVVDQATDEAARMRERINDPAIVELGPVRSALMKLCGETSGDILGISTLRGQFEDNAEWRGNPSRPAVIVGTIDMIGSRLLFSGYGLGFKTKPLHAGFLGQDALLVHDEAHLEPAFQELLVTIREEQRRCGEFGKFQVMALSATSRAKNGAFGLTEVEKNVPNQIPGTSETPLHVIWRRQGARKQIRLHIVQEELTDDIAAEALKFANQACAVLVFARKVEDVEKIAGKLKAKKQKVQQLTGTLRGWERDQLVKRDPIFSRFLRQTQPAAATVYLVCTSAGEVGVNISADHLICDLSPFDSMVQRFGRVNRFGDRDDTQIHIFHPAQADFKDDELDRRRQKTLALLKKLDGDASPKAIGELMNAEDCQAAFTPPPTILPATDILFDAWALTTIKGKLPGRPPVECYLHGVSEYEPPETRVAWREEVGVITGDLLKQNPPGDLLEDYPLKPHEWLRDRSDRVHKRLSKLAERLREKSELVPVWLLADDDSVEELTLEKVASSKKERIENCMVLLPPSAGGLSEEGSLDGDSEKANDVADMWQDANGNQRRNRVWDDKITEMRLIRTIDIDPDAEDEADDDEEEASRRRYWNWYERPKAADNDGSERDTGAVLWEVHTDDVVRNAIRIVNCLALCEKLREAIVLAARFHDLGKWRPLFQTNIGNPGCVPLLAKSGKKTQRYTANKNFRHEFASLLDIQKEPEFLRLTPEMQDLVLHLVAVHHGYGRPHFPTEQAYDPQATDGMNSTVADQVPQRFARLQRQYGRWGLAYLESLLRAADYAASANPSAFWEGEQ